MTLGQLRTAVRERLDDPTFDTIKLDRWINWVLQDIYSRAKLPYECGEVTLTTTMGVGSYSFSSIASDVDKISKVLNGSTELVFVPNFEDVTLEDSTPRYWSTKNGSLVINAPDAVYNLTVEYVKNFSDLSDQAQSPALPDKFSELIVLGAYQKALEWNDDWAYAGVIERQYEQKLARMVASSKETSGQEDVTNWYRPEI